jgi:hypothetical protein
MSNILGPCSITVLFQAGATTFEWLQDLSGHLFRVISVVFALSPFRLRVKVAGGLLNANFVIYIGFICSFGRRGVLAASEHQIRTQTQSHTLNMKQWWRGNGSSSSCDC